jgi:nucleoside triphosphatase
VSGQNPTTLAKTSTNPSGQRQFPLSTVGALVVNDRGQVLIVKTTKWRGTWGVPGGKVEWGESLVSALIREFQEEVGLELTQIRFALLQEAILDSQFCQPAHFMMINYYAFSAGKKLCPMKKSSNGPGLTPEKQWSIISTPILKF